MGTTRANIASKLHDMVAAPASSAAYKVIFRTEDGVLIGYSTLSLAGLDVLTDDFAPGCLMLDTTNNRWYSNKGTKASPDFQYIANWTDA